MSRKMRAGLGLLLLLMVLLALEVFCADWPQLQNNAQRTGYQSENLSMTNTVVWNVDWTSKNPPEQLSPATQLIIVGGQVFVGTELGNFYCLNATNGSQLWKYPTGAVNHVGPILHSAGAENGKVFFASMDGCVYALDYNGNFQWKFDSGAYVPGTFKKGFSSAILLAEGKVFVARRDGYIFAINEANGSQIWQINLGCTLFHTPAYNNGKVYIGGLDRYVYAINSSNGTLAWKSTVAFPGMGFQWYYPVVDSVRGVIILKTASDAPYQTPDDIYAYLLRESDGSQITTLNVPCHIGMHQGCPPCIDRDGYYMGGINTAVGYNTTWTRCNPINGQLDVIGNGGDNGETCVFTAAGNLIFLTYLGGGPWATGNGTPGNCYNIDTRAWSTLNGSQLSGHWLTNTQGGGASGGAISNGMLYKTCRGNISYCVR